ncbi:MAG: RHS repeat-associated core domain-containing protein, partial [Solirubrobacteraceae bacterium]
GNGAGQFNEAPHGLAFSGSYVYVLDSGNWWENTGNSRIQKWTIPITTKNTINNTQTVYYTTAANSKYTKCGEHPEWAGMPCQTQPATQPTTSGLPGLAVTSYTYNMYLEPTQVKAEVAKVGGGADTRTTTTVYDEAGRPETVEINSTVGTALPKVTDKYSSTTGALVEQSTSTESLKSEYNTLGQLTSYTDADGNQSTYEYETEKDYRLKKMSDGKGTQTYEYDEMTGAVKELKDTTGANTLTFTAAYDVEGNMTSETYPDALTTNYIRNTTGEITGIEYVKTDHCAKTCPEAWYKDVAVPSSHGQWLTQQSELGAQTTTHSYEYDETGRLTQTTDNVGGKNCVTRIYAYEEETNRLSLTTRPPGTGGACATEGGEIQADTYDPANRLLDTGTEYDSFGNTTKLPAADAGGTTITSTFYDDNQLASQTQGTQTIGDQLDPAGRVREIVSTGKVADTEIQHYSSPESQTPSWTSEVAGNYTRYIAGISGCLVAIRHNTEKAALQLTNLHGDIIATAHEAESSTSLESSIPEASEDGVPAAEGPPKYSWLGAYEEPTTLPSGTIAMGARSYIPQLGRFLQADPIPGGSSNPYAYTDGDPVNQTDLTGAYVENNYVLALGMQQNERAIELEAAREAAIRKEAEERAREAAIQARFAAQEAAELAEAEAHNLWDAEAAAGPPGAIAGGGMEEEGVAIGTRVKAITDAGGCPSTHDPCYPKGGKGGSANEGGCPKGSKGKSCDSHGGNNSDCAAMVAVTSSPGMWTPAGWVSFLTGEILCAASGSD